jgi:hypothetical protein
VLRRFLFQLWILIISLGIFSNGLISSDVFLNSGEAREFCSCNHSSHREKHESVSSKSNCKQHQLKSHKCACKKSKSSDNFSKSIKQIMNFYSIEVVGLINNFKNQVLFLENRRCISEGFQIILIKPPRFS